MTTPHEDGIPKPVAFRITVGVTGHRRISDSRQLRKIIHGVLDHISERYRNSNSGAAAFCALTPLAEGADCIVAEEILSRSDVNAPTLKVVLPLTVDDYRKDFTSAAARKTFENLMSKARVALTLRNESLAEEYASERPNPDKVAKARRQAYEDVGRFVVDHCDILIALWDGRPANGQGGTADTVSYARHTRCPVYVVDPQSPQTFRYLGDPDETVSLKGLDRCFDSIKEFNQRLASLGEHKHYVDNLYRDIFQSAPEAVSRSIAEDTKRLVKTSLMPYYAMASVTAKSYQKIYRCVGLSVFWFAFAAVATIGIGAIFFHSEPVFFAVELGILSTISLMILYDDRFVRSHRKWMQYRFLAERIRSAFFLACCGTTLQPFHIPRRLGGNSNPDLWMALVFEEIWSATPATEGISEANCDSLGDFIRHRWVDDQLEFHRQTVRTNRQRSQLLELVGGCIFFAAIAAAAAHLALPHLFASFHQRGIAAGLTLAALVLPAMAAAVEAIRSHREYKRLAIRSARIGFELQRIRARLSALTPAKLQRAVSDMAELMWTESEEWMTMMGTSELHVVV
jgi:hypothetical protein